MMASCVPAAHYFSVNNTSKKRNTNAIKEDHRTAVLERRRGMINKRTEKTTVTMAIIPTMGIRTTETTTIRKRKTQSVALSSE